MAQKRHLLTLTSAVILLSACSMMPRSWTPTANTSNNTPSFWSKATGASDTSKGAYASNGELASISSSDASTYSANGADNTMVITSNVNPYDGMTEISETVVSRKVALLRSDKDKIKQYADSYDATLSALSNSSEQTTQIYHDVVADVNAHLQRGTTPGNPILVQKAQIAQRSLNNISNDITSMNVLANDIASNASLASYLMDAIRATYGVSGAIDEDHRQLKLLEGEVDELNAQTNRQLREVNEAITRRSSSLSVERQNLQTMTLAIANGELYGKSLASRPGYSGNAPTALNGGGSINESKPLVVIRFDRPDVEFEQAVYLAASQALEKYPNVNFEVAAVSPMGASPTEVGLKSKNNAQAVLQSMSQMGIPNNRITQSSKQSPMAKTSEVHIFLR